jgi:hypothetical protein
MFVGIADLCCVVNLLLCDHMLIISAAKNCNQDIMFFVFPSWQA